MAEVLPLRGLTPNETARLLRIGPDRVRSLIARGELGALNLGTRGGKPRFIVLPAHLEAFTRQHAAATPAAKQAPRRKRQAGLIDFYPDA